jgi:hypothetical protein
VVAALAAWGAASCRPAADEQDGETLDEALDDGSDADSRDGRDRADVDAPGEDLEAGDADADEAGEPDAEEEAEGDAPDDDLGAGDDGEDDGADGDAGGRIVVERLAGSDLWGTVALASARFFRSAEHVVVALGDVPVTYDALVGAPLARRLEGPVLLVETAAVPSAACEEIGRFGTPDAHVVGGPDVVSDAAADALVGCGAAAWDRFSGPDAVTTAARAALSVAMGLPCPLAVIGIASGDPTAGRYDGPAAALAAGLVVPLLFVSRDGIPAATADALEALGVVRTIVAAPQEVIPSTVADLLPAAERLVGSTPEEIARGVALRLLDARVGAVPVAVVWLSTDALAPETGPAAALGIPVLFVRSGALLLPEPTESFLREARERIERVIVLGTTDRIPSAIDAAIRAVLEE